MGKSIIYADNAATTRLSSRAFDEAAPFLRDSYGNASSLYSLGVASRRAVELARARIAESLGASPDEIYFTSGGSEGNAWVLSSVASGSVLTSPFEHPSVWRACERLARRGVEVLTLPVDSSGVVRAVDVAGLSRDDARLVSITTVNNEIGTIQPIAEIGSILRSRGVLFHTDAVQAVGHIPLDVKRLGVDFLTGSAHKFNGPKGVGFLYVRRGVEPPTPLILGGEQERGLRAGTENVFGLVATGAALAENVAALEENAERARATVRAMLGRLGELLTPGEYFVVAEGSERVAGVVDLVFRGAGGEAMVQILDFKGVCVSSGSACSSGRDRPSRVLLALGLSEEEAKSAVRVSFGRENAPEDGIKVAEALAFAYRKIVGARLR